MVVINLNLTYAVEVTWKHITFHDFLVTMLPVFIFFVLGLSMAWLIYQAWQEQAYLEALVGQLSRERELVKQKRNFVTLSSHYLRTPLAIIANSIDLAIAKGGSQPSLNTLKALSQDLAGAVNGLLAIAQTELPQSQTPPRPKSINSSVRYLAFSVIGAFIAVSLGIYLLVYLNKDDVKLTTWLVVLAMVLLVAVIIFSARRVHYNRKRVKQYFKELIVQHRILDAQRSEVVNRALGQIKNPLEQLKSSVASVEDTKLRAYLWDGIAKFEHILQKFVIYDGLRMGTMSTSRQEFDFNDLVQRVTERHSQAISVKQLKLETDIKLANMAQDALLLEYVIDSIVDNAIAYSPQNQRIKIIAKKKGETGMISIEDRGAGIEASKLSLLFQPFSSAEDPLRFEHEGMGLSLYLDKLIMLYIGGNILAESKKGHGTSIRITFAI